MGAVEAQRTLVKSVPEVWATLSEVSQLGPMLDGAFGEIRITRLEPESRIEWQGELANGLVELTASGFGTRVRLIAEIDELEPEPAPEPVPPADTPPPRRGLLARLLRRRSAPPAPEPVPAVPTVPAVEHGTARGALTAVLDEVGTPRHRPFSRDTRAARPIA